MQQRNAVPCTTLAAIHTWAAQKRRLFVETETSLPCVLGRIKDERVAAGAGDFVRRQKWPEVYWADGLAVQMIVLTLAETPRLALSFYYILRGTPAWCSIRLQCLELQISKSVYWGALESAEVAVDSGLRLLSMIEPKTISSSVSR